MIDSAGEVEGLENVLWLALLLIALLAGAVLYLFINQRGFQRIDYRSLIDQEEQERRLQARLAYIEQLIADFAAYDRRRRQELEQLAEHARAEVAQQLSSARSRLADEILRDAAAVDHLILTQAHTRRSRSAQLPREPMPGDRRGNANVRRFLDGQRQQQIAGLLEEGYDPREVARILGISRQEVEMISALVFNARSA